MVHQHFTLVPAFTVAENLALDAPTRGRQALRPYRAEAAAEHALATARSLGWELPSAARVADLPVGMQQRVEIVKALATDARLLIFDEPTAVLSRNEIGELFEVLRRLRATGKTVLLIAHKLSEILAIADRVTVLRRGRRVASCLVQETDAEQLAAWMIGAAPTSSAPSPIPDPVRLMADTSVAPALNAVGLRVRGDRGEQSVHGIGLTVGRGEIFGIGGVDGNGQTELAEALTGLRPCEADTLTWGAQPFQPGRAPRLGYIPQDRRRMGLALSMSVADNLLFDAVREPEFRVGPLLRRRALGDLAESLMRDFDIRASGPGLPAAALSGGNQQKIVVARALRGAPELIVAMNPTRGLDIGATRFVHSQLRLARNRGAAIVLISTDLDELAALSDRAAILSNGELSSVNLRDADETQIGLLLGGVPKYAATEAEPIA